MRLSGTVDILGKMYAFTRIETDSKVGWYIFNTVRVSENGDEVGLDIFSLQDFVVSNLQPFLVAASEVSTEEYKTYGNMYFINVINKAFSKCINTQFKEVNDEIIKDGEDKVEERYLFRGVSDDVTLEYEKLTQMSLMKKVNKSSDDSTSKKYRVSKSGLFTTLNFSTGDVKLTTIYTSNTGFHKKKEFKVEWETFDTMSSQELKFKEYNLSLKAKSLSQLRMTRDLSWYFDERGKPKKDYIVVDTLDKLEYYCKDVFPNVKFWALDVETTGLNMYESEHPELMDHIVSIMFAWKKGHAIFIPFDMEYMRNIPPEAWDMLKPWMEKIPCGGHNIGFDARANLVDIGIEINLMHDTQILNFNINTHRAKYNNSLKFLEHKYLKVDTLELKDIFGTSKLAGLFRYLPKELALIYACPDVEYWLDVFEVLWKMLPVSGRKAYMLDMRTLKHIYKADAVGTRIDTVKAMELRELNNKDRDMLAELIYKFVGQSIAQRNYLSELSYEIEHNNLTDEQALKLLEDFFQSDRYVEAREEFNLNSGPKLAEIMYTKLGYPILAVSRDTGRPAVNAGALKELLKQKVEDNSNGWLKKDIQSHMLEVDPTTEPIIKAEDFNSHAYPLPLLIGEYRLRHKRDTTFFKAIIDNAIGGVYYTQSKMASAETFRIINTIQVLQGVMKKLCIPKTDDDWMLVFDFSQIEYRHMGGLAKVKSLVKNLNRFRADFHVECCALLHDKPAWTITKKMRSEAKSINFAIPYGMGIASIAQSLYKAVTEITKIHATRQYNKWLEIFHEIKELLDEFRKNALEYGYVQNELGRRRYFFNNDESETLDDWKKLMSKGKREAIKRAAGNYPIQSGAADLFKIAFCQFRERLEKEGLADYVKTSALVHDEIQSSVSKNVNPYYLYKIIWEECMLTLKGHPRYFAGISVVDNWYEGKADLYEAPIEFVDYIINSGKADDKFVRCEDPKNMVLNDIKEFMKGVFIKDFKDAGLDCTSNKLDIKHLLENLQDYFLRGKLPLYFPPSVKANKDYENDAFIKALESFCLGLGYHEEIEVIYPDDYPEGKRAFVSKDKRAFIGDDGVIMREVVIQTPVKDDSLVDTEINLDFGENDGLSLSLDMDTLDMLDMLETDDAEHGIDDSFYSGPIYFCYDRRTSGPVDDSDKIDVDNMLDSEYIQMYGIGSSKVVVEMFRLVLDIDDCTDEQKENLMNYCNSIAVSEDSVGAREIVFKLGINVINTGCYVGEYSLEKLKELLGEELNVNS